MRRFILTGAPGAGKTAILRGLEAAGHAVVEEAATDINALELARGIDEPSRALDFIEAILTLQRRRRQAADRLHAEIVFFDRSEICTHALASYLGATVPPALLTEIARIKGLYERRVFFIESLGFMTNTEVRRISLADADRFGRVHKESYRTFGYSMASILPVALDERVATIEQLAKFEPS